MSRFIDSSDRFDDDDDQPYRAKVKVRDQQRSKAGRSSRRVASQRAEERVNAADQPGQTTTYKPARYEELWLRESLASFYAEELIVDVLAAIKGGKEASVYLCEAHQETGLGLLAAKVYRPRQFRNLRNDKLYREGRAILTADGRPVKQTDDRIMRAIGKKTDFGAQVLHTSWLMYEYTTLERLHRAGAAVPQPVAASENAILMTYYGDERRAAPALNEIALDQETAEQLFSQILETVEIMLQHQVVHGDLSAYNILYWDGRGVVIDFPQVTSVQGNPQAYAIFRRDITRICEYFARQGLVRDAGLIIGQLWSRYVAEDPDAMVDELWSRAAGQQPDS